MPAELPVHVNREDLHSLEVPARFETDGSLDVRLINHGESVHVHLHLEGVLADAGAIDANNHYVTGDSERVVRIAVADGVRGLGKLKVATSYGAETRYIDVEFTEPEVESGSVQVDESLAHPQPDPEPDPGLIEDPRVPIVGLGVVAVTVAAVAVFVIDEPSVALAAVGVIAAVVIAVYVAVVVE